jgi:hypothetical protein
VERPLEISHDDILLIHNQALIVHHFLDLFLADGFGSFGRLSHHHRLQSRVSKQMGETALVKLTPPV